MKQLSTARNTQKDSQSCIEKRRRKTEKEMTEKGESREKRAINSIITSLSKIDTKNQSFKNTELTTKDQKSKTWNKN